jgi:hypothetical protein
VGEDERMIDPNHLFTVHHTYTGLGCAVCGLAPCEHPSFDWLVEGEKRIDPLDRSNAPCVVITGSTIRKWKNRDCRTREVVEHV